MQDEAPLKKAIDAGLAYIAKEQLDDGGFTSFSSPAIKNFKPARAYRTNFTPALMLASLSAVNNRGSQAIRSRLATFLAGQASPAWSFNYWVSGSKERREQPYPDDLDDTFCALSGLFLHDAAMVSEEVLARAVKLLLATETNVGGPYRTWLVPPKAKKAWQDVDVAVNSNISYFLSLVSKPLPNIVGLIDSSIKEKKLTSPYYPSAYPLVYYAARGYSGKYKELLADTAQSLLAGTNTPLNQALAISSLLRLGVGCRPKTIEKLLRQQAADGSWPAAAFCLDPAIDGRPHYSGAATLTTAFAIEALALYRTARLDQGTDTTRPIAGQGSSRKAVLALAENQSGQVAPELRSTTARALRGLAASNNGPEIIDLARHFNQSLRQPLQPRSKNFFDNLGLANLYGWLAYTVYDDFLDDEGQPALLPAANLAMRNSLDNFSQAMPARPSFQKLVRQVFDTIDGANAWELAHCRFRASNKQVEVGASPDYGDLSKLAERSLGHTLAPLAVLSAKGVRLDSAAFKHTQGALVQYLIVRQLNDDVHDWQADLANGHISYVVARILADLRMPPGNYRLSPLLAKMRRQFWHETLPVLCQDMQARVILSRQALKASNMFIPDNIISKLLDKLEASTNDAAGSQHEAVNFLRHFSGQDAG